MERRTFLKSCFGVLVLPLTPKTKVETLSKKVVPLYKPKDNPGIIYERTSKNKPNRTIRWRRYARLDTSMTPLTEGITPPAMQIRYSDIFVSEDKLKRMSNQSQIATSRMINEALRTLATSQI